MAGLQYLPVSLAGECWWAGPPNRTSNNCHELNITLKRHTLPPKVPTHLTVSRVLRLINSIHLVTFWLPVIILWFGFAILIMNTVSKKIVHLRKIKTQRKRGKRKPNPKFWLIECFCLRDRPLNCYHRGTGWEANDSFDQRGEISHSDNHHLTQAQTKWGASSGVMF